ncbi:MAG: hypothetical protein MK097_00490 [Dechloromonas sp.]|nr:hypothetical protein [Dechloromonas sp.]
MNRIGVSSVVALGNTQDVDFGEVLDYLVYDEQTRYILLHVEKIGNARRFLSGLRSAARVKPVILFKSSDQVVSGLSEAGAPETACLDDAVFDAAVRRAGAIRVSGISQLFHAARALAAGFRPRGKRLAVISNGTGPAAMAADSARAFGVPLAGLSDDTVAALRRVLASDWKGVNPVDLGGDATPERYLQSIEAVRLASMPSWSFCRRWRWRNPAWSPRASPPWRAASGYRSVVVSWAASSSSRRARFLKTPGCRFSGHRKP